MSVYPMAPKSIEVDAVASPLRVVAVTTADMETTRRFHVDALAMRAESHHVNGPEGRHLGVPLCGRSRQVTSMRLNVESLMPVRPSSAAPR